MPKRATKKAAGKRKKARTVKSKNTRTRKKLVAGKTKTRRGAAKKKKSTGKRSPAKKTAKKRAAVKKVIKKKAGKKRLAVKKTAKKKSAVKKVIKKKPAAKTTAAAKKKQPARKQPVVAIAKTKQKVKKGLVKALREIDRIKLPADYHPSNREKYMCAEQLAYFNQRLLEWKDALMRGVDKTVDNLKHEVNNYADSMDRATHEEEFDLELRTRDRERKLIRKINRALALIDNKKYGYCTECSAKIGLKRIEARPTATLCIDCKTTQEFQEKQIAEDL